MEVYFTSSLVTPEIEARGRSYGTVLVKTDFWGDRARQVFSGKGSVVIVDDEEACRNCFVRDAKKARITDIRVYKDGMEAIKKLKPEIEKGFRPDVYVTDIRMPGPDGIETYEAIFGAKNGGRV